MEENIKVIVVTHKDCKMPMDSMYVPVGVGAAKEELRKKFYTDDFRDNISDKNGQYSELTALYWAWKNIKCEYLGLVHYRRYLSMSKRPKTFDDVLSANQVLDLLQKYDVLVPQHAWYPETIEKHFINCKKDDILPHTHYIDVLRNTIQNQFPKYLNSFNDVMDSHKAHMYNMFIMKKEDADEYCDWLFSVLFSVESKISGPDLEMRVMGGLGEFLLDTWLMANGKRIKELKLYQTEMKSGARLIKAAKKRFLN